MDLQQIIQNEVEAKLGAKLGDKHSLDSATTSNTIGNAVTAILGGLQHNVATPTGAKTLNDTLAKHHTAATTNTPISLDNGILQSEGAKIIGHIFGGSSGDVTDTVAKSSGVSNTVAQDILTAVGPLVLSQLGQSKKSNGLDAKGLSAMLTKQKLPQGGIMGALSSVLDRNKDGNVVDDLFDIGKGLFGKK